MKSGMDRGPDETHMPRPVNQAHLPHCTGRGGGRGCTEASHRPPFTSRELRVNHQRTTSQTYGVDVTLEEESNQSERRKKKKNK